MKITSIIKQLSGGNTVVFHVEDPLPPEDTQHLNYGSIKISLAASLLTCELAEGQTMDMITPEIIGDLNTKFAVLAQSRLERIEREKKAARDADAALVRLANRINLPLV